MKKESRPFVVMLPLVNLGGINRIDEKELVRSSSGRGAVSRALYRKVSNDFNREKKGQLVGCAMSILDNNYRGAGRYAYEIQEAAEYVGGIKIVLGAESRNAQLNSLKERLSENLGGSKEDYMTRAEEILRFYEKRS